MQTSAMLMRNRARQGQGHMHARRHASYSETKRIIIRNSNIKRHKVLSFFGFQDLDGNFNYLMHPDSMFQTLWGACNAVFLIYIAIVLPVSTAWENELGCQWNLIHFDVAIDIFYMIDVAINVFTSVRVVTRVETKFVPNFNRYLKSWFVFDVFVSIPTTLIQFCLGIICGEKIEKLGAVKLLRMIRLIRVVRVIKFFNLSFLKKIKGNHFVYSLLKLAMLQIFIMHLAGCGFWFVKTFDSDLDLWEVKYNLHDHPIADKYMASLYFAAATLVTVGYGDIYAVNAWERGYCFVLMLIGAGVFATIISSISNLVDATTSHKKATEEKLSQMIEFFEFHHVSPQLQERIKAFQRYNDEFDSYKTNLGSMVSTLPGPLGDELKIHLTKRVVGGATGAFAEATDDYLMELFSILKPLKVSPNEVIFNAGDRATPVYFVYQGVVNIVLPDGCLIAVSDGKFNSFGESVITSGATMREYSALAPDYATLYYCEKKDIDRINMNFPDMRAKIKSYANVISTRRESVVSNTSKWMSMKGGIKISITDPNEAARKIQLWYFQKKKEFLEKNGFEVDVSIIHRARCKLTFGKMLLQNLKTLLEREENEGSSSKDDSDDDGGPILSVDDAIKDVETTFSVLSETVDQMNLLSLTRMIDALATSSYGTTSEFTLVKTAEDVIATTNKIQKIVHKMNSTSNQISTRWFVEPPQLSPAFGEISEDERFAWL